MTTTSRKRTLVAMLPTPEGGEREYEIEYAYTPGDPGCRTLPNGDPGYPGTGPAVEWLTARLILSHGQESPVSHRYGDPIDWDDLIGVLELNPIEAQALDDRLYAEACEQEDQSGDEPPDYDEED